MIARTELSFLLHLSNSHLRDHSFTKSDCFKSLWSQQGFGNQYFHVLVSLFSSYTYEFTVFPKMVGSYNSLNSYKQGVKEHFFKKLKKQSARYFCLLKRCNLLLCNGYQMFYVEFMQVILMVNILTDSSREINQIMGSSGPLRWLNFENC